jgi:hypothetical protein
MHKFEKSKSNVFIQSLRAFRRAFFGCGNQIEEFPGFEEHGLLGCGIEDVQLFKKSIQKIRPKLNPKSRKVIPNPFTIHQQSSEIQDFRNMVLWVVGFRFQTCLKI